MWHVCRDTLLLKKEQREILRIRAFFHVDNTRRAGRVTVNVWTRLMAKYRERCLFSTSSSFLFYREMLQNIWEKAKKRPRGEYVCIWLYLGTLHTSVTHLISCLSHWRQHSSSLQTLSKHHHNMQSVQKLISNLRNVYYAREMYLKLLGPRNSCKYIFLCVSLRVFTFCCQFFIGT